MKNTKRFFAVFMSMVVALSMMMAMSITSFAAAGDMMSTPENTITATDVTKGDSVSYIQLVEWKDGNWALTTVGESCGISLADLKDGISEAEAATIAEKVTAAGTPMTADTAGTTFTATPVAAGLYYLKAVPAADNKDTVYNPAFVSADYYEGGNTISFSSSYADSAVVKKSSVPFDKEVTGADKFVDTKPGDIIHFPGHFALYAGNGKMVHAANKRAGICVSNVWTGRILSVRRIITD